MTARRPFSRPRASRRTIILVALVAALATGCTEKLVQPPPPEPLSGVPDSVQAIFTAHCSNGACHGGSSPQQGMDLSNARASWLAIVGVPSNQRPQFQRIEPGDSLDSYVVMKLRNDPRKGGQPMPLGGFPLDPALVLRVAAWAQNGAPAQDQPASRTGRIATR